MLKKSFRCFVCLVITFSMFLGMLPLNIFALDDSNSASISVWDGTVADGFAGGSGTLNDPYTIANAAQLAYLAETVNSGTSYIGKFFKLTNDIILNDTSDYEQWKACPPSNNWKPIGVDELCCFEGIFDGCSHKISGIYIDSLWSDGFYTQGYWQGLFGYIGSGSVVKNLEVEETCIATEEVIAAAGGIAGGNDGIISNCHVNAEICVGHQFGVGGITGSSAGKIENCHFTGNVEGGFRVGGISGANVGSIKGCDNSGTVSGNYYVGGIVGENGNNSKIINCNNYGEVYGSSVYSGGVSGMNEGLIDHCSNSGVANGNIFVGGIAGYSIIPFDANETKEIINCYNNGTVSGSLDVGGIVGENDWKIRNCYNEGVVDGGEEVGGIAGINTEESSIYYCYNIGKVGENAYASVGGIVGLNYNTVSNCYYLDSSIVYSTNTIGTKRTLSELKKKSNYSNWDFNGVWQMSSTENAGYPFLRPFSDDGECEHSYFEINTEPTCALAGNTTHICLECGNTYQDNFVAPTGHILDEFFKCVICGRQFDGPLRYYSLFVCDIETLKPIEGASVTLNGKTVSTDGTGLAFFQFEGDASSAKLKITADTYPDYPESDYILNSSNSDYIYLTSDESEIYGAWCNGDNVLNGKSQINADAHALTARIVINGRAKANIQRYELVQGSVIIAESTDGVFNIRNYLFKMNRKVTARMITDGSDGHNVFERDINIKVVGFSFEYGTDWGDLFKLSGDVTIDYPNGVPAFGGAKLSFKMPFKNIMDTVSVFYDNNKVMITLGFDMLKKPEDLIKKGKKEIAKELYETWRDDGKPDKKNKVKGSIAIIVEFTDAGVTDIYGQIGVSTECEYSIGKTYMVGFIPVYAEVGMSLNGKYEITKLGYDIENSRFEIPEFELTLKGDITLYGGLGFKAVSVGEYGKAGIEIVLSSDDWDSMFERLTLSGELGVYAKIKPLFFKELCYKYPLWHGEKTWPERAKMKLKLFSAEAYDDNARSYLIERSDWLNSPPAADGTDPNVLLQSSSYNAIEPKIVTCGDTVMMVFMDDDGSEGLNYQHLYYSLYDAAAGTWSVPRSVDDNDRPDVEFDVFANDSSIYIAYTEFGEIAEEDKDDYEKILGSAEVAVAEYSFAENKFVDHTYLTSDDSYDTSPKVSETEEGITVVWVNSISNDVFSQDANNVLRISTLKGGEWTEAEELTGRGATVVSIDIGTLNGVSYAAVIRDVDCDLSTTDDRVLSLIDFDGNEIRVHSAADSNDGVQFVGLNGKTLLVWYNGSNLYYIDSVSGTAKPMLPEAVNGLSGNYRLLQIDPDTYAVLFVKNERTDADGTSLNGSNVYGIFCNNGEWGEAIPVTQNEAGYYVDAFDVCMSGGRVIIPFIKADVKFTDSNISKTVDFMSASLRLENDLSVGEAEYSAEGLFGVDEIGIHIPVKNGSWQDLSSLSYEVRDPLGRSVCSGTVVCGIKSGATEYLEVSLPADCLDRGADYSLFVTTSDWMDNNEGNNEAELNLWYTDFLLTTSQVLIAGKEYIQYSIENDGNIGGSAVLRVYKRSDDGAEITILETDISNLDCGESVSGSLEVTPDYYSDGVGSDRIYVSLIPEKDELYEFDNTVCLTVGDFELSRTVGVVDTAVEGPTIDTPYIRYDKAGGSGISVSVSENGWSFGGAARLSSEAYSYSNGMFSVSGDYLSALERGFYSYELKYNRSGLSTDVRLIVEIADSGYQCAEIMADDQIFRYDGNVLELGNDIKYSTLNQGTVSAEYSSDNGLSWASGLPKDVGSYLVRISAAVDDENHYSAVNKIINVEIEKGTRAISIPIVTDTSGSRVIFGGSVPTAGQADGTVLYGYSLTDNCAEVDEWLEAGMLPEVDSSAVYYIFAKITGSKNYGDAFSLGFAVDAYLGCSHDYSALTTAPTCTEQGYTTYTCTKCGDSFVDSYVEALGHDLIHHEGRDAACTENGWEAYDTCSRCEYTTYKEIEKSGHDLIHHEGRDAACTENGWEAYDTCSRCEYTTYKEIEKLGHDLIHHEGRDAACTENGWEAYDTCSRCEYTTYKEIEMLGHSFTVYISDGNAACTEDGTKTAHCDHAGCTTADTVSDVGSKLGHSYEWVVDTAATNMQTGIRHEECTRCHIRRSEGTVIPIVTCEHDFASAVSDEGYTVYYCRKCGIYYLPGAVLSGNVTSFGDSTQKITIKLTKQGESSAAHTTTVTGNSTSYSITGVAAGTYTLTVSKTNHVTREYTVTVGSENVTQDVKIHLFGDANGDGRVDSKDLSLLRKYMASYDYTTGTSTVAVQPGADANGDGTIDSKDLSLLRKYMASYDYTTGTSTVVLGPSK